MSSPLWLLHNLHFSMCAEPVAGSVGWVQPRSVYVASAAGFAESTLPWYQQTLLPALNEAGFTVLDPWADPDGQTGRTLAEAAAVSSESERLQTLRALNQQLGARNAAALRECDAVLAVLDGPDVDSGTAAEIGYAAALAKPVVGLRTDFRLVGDNAGATVNLQVQYFIENGGGRIHASVPDAVAALSDLADG